MTTNLDKNTAIAIIESLRAGIPTRVSIRELPDLRPELTTKIIRDLEQLATGNKQKQKGRFIWGGYGQGKTHELTNIEYKALEMGFAVSRVTLSRELSGQHMLRLYAKLASSIRTPDSKLFGIQHKLNTKRADDLNEIYIHAQNRYTHELPLIVLENYFYANEEESELLYGDLIGCRLPISEIKRVHKKRGQDFPKLPVFKIANHGHAYCEVMSDVLTWCGYKGWVILIDEVELIARLGKVARLNAYRNLNWLLNWSNDNIFPLYCVCAAADPLQTRWINTELKQETLPQTKVFDKTLIPTLARERFGETDERKMINFFEQALDENQCPKLLPVESKQLEQIMRFLVNIHASCYEWTPKLDIPNFIESLGYVSLRICIRALLESLDIDFLYNVDFKPKLDDLVDGLDVNLEDDEFFSEDS